MKNMYLMLSMRIWEFLQVPREKSQKNSKPDRRPSDPLYFYMPLMMVNDDRSKSNSYTYFPSLISPHCCPPQASAKLVHLISFSSPQTVGCDMMWWWIRLGHVTVTSTAKNSLIWSDIIWVHWIDLIVCLAENANHWNKNKYIKKILQYKQSK